MPFEFTLTVNKKGIEATIEKKKKDRMTGKHPKTTKPKPMATVVEQQTTASASSLVEPEAASQSTLAETPAHTLPDISVETQPVAEISDQATAEVLFVITETEMIAEAVAEPVLEAPVQDAIEKPASVDIDGSGKAADDNVTEVDQEPTLTPPTVPEQESTLASPTVPEQEPTLASPTAPAQESDPLTAKDTSEWTDEKNELLLSMKASNRSWKEIASALGHGKDFLRKRYKELVEGSTAQNTLGTDIAKADDKKSDSDTEAAEVNGDEIVEDDVESIKIYWDDTVGDSSWDNTGDGDIKPAKITETAKKPRKRSPEEYRTRPNFVRDDGTVLSGRKSRLLYRLNDHYDNVKKWQLIAKDFERATGKRLNPQALREVMVPFWKDLRALERRARIKQDSTDEEGTP